MSGLLERLQSKKGGRRAHTAAGTVVRTDSAGFAAFKSPTVVVETPIKLGTLEVVPLGGELPASTSTDERLPRSSVGTASEVSRTSPERVPEWLAEPPRTSGVLDALVPRALEIIDERFPRGGPAPGDITPVHSAVETAAQSLTREIRLGADDMGEGITELAEYLWGYGPLTPLFDDPAVTDIWIDHFDTISCRRKGDSLKTPFRFRSNGMYRSFVARLLDRHGVSTPVQHTTISLLDRWHTRFDVVFPPLTYGGEPRVSLRIPRVAQPTMYELVRAKTVPVKFGAWLAEAAHSGAAHIFVVGAPGTGRTTLAAALIAAIGSLERIATIETVAELFSPAGNIEKFLAPPERHPELIDIARCRAARRLALGDASASGSAALQVAVERGWRGLIGVLDAPTAEAAVAALQRNNALPATSLLFVEMEIVKGTPCLGRVREAIFTEGTLAAMPTLVSFQGIREGRREWETSSVETPLRRQIVPQGISPDGSAKSRRTEGAWQRS